MKFKLGKRLRHYWHEVYYFLATDRGIHFAMKCRDVAERIDIGEKSPTFLQWCRFQLHLSLCQPCRNYQDASKALGAALKKWVAKEELPVDLESLKTELLKKHSIEKK